MSRHESRLSVDTALEILASSRRRQLLHYLLDDADPPLERDVLVDQMAGETTTDPESLAAALAHHHLPRLADAGVIEYDHRSGGVRLDESADDLKPLLELCQEWESPDDRPE